MSLDTSGFLLEGVRVATGNNPFTYPPRDVVSDPSAFASSPGRADYMVFVAGQTSGSAGIDIGDPALRLLWTRNNGTVSRFDFDAFARRWNTLPGGPPDDLGVMGNQKRLIAPVPDTTVTESPYALYVGSPSRLVTFAVQKVSTSSDFGSPPAGTVQISVDKGELNFGPVDLATPAYVGQHVFLSRQSFFDRTKSKGRVGLLPESSSSSYHLFLNPIPGAGQVPRLRIGYRPYLAVVGVPTESSLPVPGPGSAAYSSDTGRVVFSPADIDALPSQPVYYDGVLMGSSSLPRGTVGPMTATAVGSVPLFAGVANPAFDPILDPADPGSWFSVAATRFALFFVPPAQPLRYYLQVAVVDSGAGPVPEPPAGFAYVDTATGAVYVSSDDVAVAGGAALEYVDTLAPVEGGASVQLFRSSVNGSGFEAEPDFVETYRVTGQVVQDGVTQSPSVLLPTVPLVNSALSVSAAQASGGGGTFVGELVDGTDPSKLGLGYLLDLDQRQMKFVFRRDTTVVLEKESPSVKLPDPAVVPGGLRISRNGTPIKPGVDFDFNAQGGLAEFVDGVGEDDPRNVIGVSAAAVLPNRLVSAVPRFDVSQVGLYVFVPTGANVGFRRIRAVLDPQTAVVDRSWAAAGPLLADFRADREIVADRFWARLAPPLKKFKVLRKGPSDHDWVRLADDDFSVLQTTGQVNLKTAARPGDVFQVSYVSLDSPDNGVTVTPTSRTDYAAFKIRQESGTVVPASSVVRFNAAGNTVSTTNPMVVYVDGVTQDPASYKFVAPGTLTLGSPLAVDGTVPSVTINYWVRESPGGNTNFALPFSPVDVDSPVILGRDAISSPVGLLDAADVGDAPATVLNGDQTALVVPGGAVMADDKDVFLVKSAVYDASADVTRVVFSPEPEVTVSGVPLRATDAIDGDYVVAETANVDVLAKGTNTLTVSGVRDYKAGTVVLVDGDPYRAISAGFKAASGKTEVVLASSATRNYILPQVHRTVRPVLEPGGTFQTRLPAHLGYPFTLVKDGPSPGVLRPTVDYNVSEGGLVQLLAEVGHGDVLEAMYVSRTTQPAGTSLELNYAAQVAPNGTNGLQGQKLVMTYDLYSPDTFFLRRESVVSFIPEVIEDLKKSSSTGSSGPNTASKSSLKTKDMGSPSLYHDEQHMANVDVVIQRLLKFYNDLINALEDVLSDLDGRVVGGTSGRFRFDGRLDNPARPDYRSITNDLDDRVKIYDDVVLTGFFTFSVSPVYARMYDPNNLSRIFPTAGVGVAALNDKTGFADVFKTMGSFGLSNLTSVGTLSPAPAVAKFSIGANQSSFVIPANGDSKNLVPKFAPGQKVRVYAQDGTPEILGTVLSATDTLVVLDTPTALKAGGLVQDVFDPASKHFYSPGKDLIVNQDNGVISNFTLPPILSSLQNSVFGNEIVQSNVTFANTDLTPRRVPVLDGLELTDSGRPSVPPLSRQSEADLLTQELSLLGLVGNARVLVDQVSLTNLTFALSAGKVITFLTGPNAGLTVTIAAVPAPGPTTATAVVPPLTLPVLHPDPVGGDFFVVGSGGTLAATYAALLGLLRTNTATAPAGTALIGKVDSELVAASSAARSFGQQQASGSGSASGNVLTDLGANFAVAVPAITTASLLFVPDGPNWGLYKLAAVTSTTLTVSPDAPFPGFAAAGATNYVVLQPWSFLTPKGPKLVADFLASTVAFWQATAAWAAGPTSAGTAARVAAVQARQADVVRFVKAVYGEMATDDKLYDTRYLWIQQRTDKKDGTVARRVAARSRRVENSAKLAADQAKLLIAAKLVV